jgi:hypothetical protein
MDTPKIIAALGERAPRFQEELSILEKGLADKKIWNVQLVDAKFRISNDIDKAAEFYANPFYEQRRNERDSWDSNDPRFDISMFMNTQSAPKLLRGLEKHNGYGNPVILTYMEFLREVVQIGNLIKALKPYVVKGRRPVEKTEEQLRDETFNTGMCAICARRQKLEMSLGMVMHGYQMSDYNHRGWRIGKCFGVGYKPYELSNEANVAFAPVLENHRKGIAQAIRTLKSGKVTTLDVTKDKYDSSVGKRVEYTVTYTKAENPAEFAHEMEVRLARLDSELRMVTDDIKTNKAKIDNWTAQPLQYGAKGLK